MYFIKIKCILIGVLSLGVSACSSPNPNNSFQNYKPPEEVILQDNRIESSLQYGSIKIGDTLKLPKNISDPSNTATVSDFYISATGEICWELKDKNKNLISLCENNGEYKFTRSILSQKL